MLLIDGAKDLFESEDKLSLIARKNLRKNTITLLMYTRDVNRKP